MHVYEKKTLSGWRAYLSTGEALRSAETPWSELPDRIALVMLYERREWKPGRPYRVVLSGADWYFETRDLIGKSGSTHNERDEWHPPDEILERYPDAVLKRGKWTDEDIWERIREESWSEVAA